MSGTPKLPLNKRLDRLGQQIIRARLYYDLWLYFEEDNSRRKIIETMRDYNEFFRFMPHAYFVSYVIYIAGAFERRRDTINLNALIVEVRQAGKLQGPIDAEILSLMARAKPFARKAAILRHNAIAHHTDRMSYDDVFNLAQVAPTALRDLTGLALDVSNHLSVACGLREQDFTELPKHDAEQMMRALRATRS
jgi:AbiU2